MKKVLAIVAMALAMTSFANAKVVVDGAKDAITQIDASTTAAANFSDFSVFAGETFNVIKNGNGFTATVTSKKCSTLAGTINSYTNDPTVEQGAIGGNFTLINANGVVLLNGFQFNGDNFFAGISPANGIGYGSQLNKNFSVNRGAIVINKAGTDVATQIDVDANETVDFGNAGDRNTVVSILNNNGTITLHGRNIVVAKLTANAGVTNIGAIDTATLSNGTLENGATLDANAVNYNVVIGYLKGVNAGNINMSAGKNAIVSYADLAGAANTGNFTINSDYVTLGYFKSTSTGNFKAIANNRFYAGKIDAPNMNFNFDGEMKYFYVLSASNLGNANMQMFTALNNMDAYYIAYGTVFANNNLKVVKPITKGTVKVAQILADKGIEFKLVDNNN